jgi:hypothetical protein
MRVRGILAVIALSLAVVTVTPARQQAGNQQENAQRADKVSLRARVIELHVELALLEIEREADKAHLLGLMKGMRELDGASPARIRELASVQAFFDIESQDDPEKAFNKKVVSAKAYADLKKKDYARQTRQVVEMRLELAEVEKRFNDLK